MKLQGKQIGFRVTLPWFGRRRLIVHGNRNSIQLLETALVIEGFVQRLFFFPIIDRFFRMPFSEWTSVTVPYSRVLRFHYARMLTQRIVVTLLAWIPIAVMLLGAFTATRVDWAGVVVVILPLSVAALVITLYVNLSFYAPRCYLWFRHADGRRGLVAFRIPSRKRRLEFEDQLREYRRATRARGVAMQELSEAELAAPSPGIWVVIVLFLLAHQIVVPMARHLEGGATGQGGHPRAAPPGPAAPPAPEAAAFEGWYWHLLGLAVAVLPLFLMTLALVARRNEVVRWSAILSLVVFGLLPLVRFLIFVEQFPQGRPRGSEGGNAVVHALFHVALAIILLWVTAPEPKDDL